MTKFEATIAMRQGKCVKHKTFTEDEYLFMDKRSKIRDESYFWWKHWNSRDSDPVYSKGWFVVIID